MSREPEVIDRFEREYYFLSNFYPSPIQVTIRDVVHVMPTGEHAFHAGKVAASSLDEAAQQDWLRELTADSHPGNAKRAGRRINIDAAKWDRMSNRVMVRVQELKFYQHPDLLRLLLSTGDAILIEGNNWGDRIWGQVNGVGENRLGRILMDLREDARRQSRP